MSSSMEILNQILHILREKYDKINQLHNLTKEMEKALNYDDAPSFGALLDMRQKQMDAIDELGRQNRQLIAKLPEALQSRVKKILAPNGEPLRLNNPLETNIFDTNRRGLLLLQKVAALNDSVFQKMQRMK